MITESQVVIITPVKTGVFRPVSASGSRDDRMKQAMAQNDALYGPARKEILSKLSCMGVVATTFSVFPSVVVQVTPEQLTEIESWPEVQYITEEHVMGYENG